jgi:peptide-methionine (S)-S-oxide reductase
MRSSPVLRSLFALVSLALVACAQAPAQPRSPPAAAGLEEAVFAGGCFWCLEHDLAKVPGVIDAVSGYSGGASASPTYENHAGHYEVVRVRFDPKVISYPQLLDTFWRAVDPTDPGGQFCDRGPSYRTAIFASAAQRPLAEASKAALIRSRQVKGEIVTPILDAAPFWVAEDYHQDYAEKNPVRYRFYRTSCGRDARIRAVWGK